MTLDELDAARLELVGGAFGSKGRFAKMLGLKGHHSLRGYYRRGSVPKWIEDRIRILRELRDMRENLLAAHSEQDPKGGADK